MQNIYFSRTVKTFTLLPALLVSLVAVTANAEAVGKTADFVVSMAVNAPVCDVSVQNTVTLPKAASPHQSIFDYLAVNGINVKGALPESFYLTSGDLNQTATITCTTSATPITKFVVQPAPGAASYHAGQPGLASLVDTSPIPVSVGGEIGEGSNGLALSYEQVSINAKQAAQSYTDSQGRIVDNQTPFTTSDAVVDGVSTAVVV